VKAAIPDDDVLRKKVQELEEQLAAAKK